MRLINLDSVTYGWSATDHKLVEVDNDLLSPSPRVNLIPVSMAGELRNK